MISSVFHTLFPSFEDDEQQQQQQQQGKCSEDYDDDNPPDLGELSDLSQSSRESSPEDAQVALEVQQINHHYQAHPSSDPNFQSKEDQDVAMFLGLVERMSVKSLLFILQDHARSMHNISQDQLQKVLERQEIKQQRREEAKKNKKSKPKEQQSTSSGSKKKRSQSRRSSSGTTSSSKGLKKKGSSRALLQPQVEEVDNEEDEHDHTESSYNTNSISTVATTPAVPFKKFRFADILGGHQVRTQVFEIPPLEDHEKDAIWWSEEDMVRMIQDALRIVKYYKKHRRDYIRSVTVLAESYKPDTNDRQVEQHMKKLSADSVARGLEPHMLKSLATCRKQGVRAVLEEQQVRRQWQLQQQQQQQAASVVEDTNNSTRSTSSGYNNAKFGQDLEAEATADSIRRRYRKSSQLCRTLAIKMAEWDHVEALKSSLSSWGPPPKLCADRWSPYG
ncbi:hypothetical protein ACA910_009354 [Epithemia clementina (nom. ined.)]